MVIYEQPAIVVPKSTILVWAAVSDCADANSKYALHKAVERLVLQVESEYEAAGKVIFKTSLFP